MTREEAIEVLKRLVAYDSDVAEANQVAIEALSTKTDVHDLVHRNAVKPKLVDCSCFLLWLLDEVMNEDNWELNAVAKGETICRKLKKLGLLEVKDGYYVRIPSSEADRPTGEWVTLERDENVYDIYGVPTWGVSYMCDKCGFITTAIQDHFGQYKFCPNCGAKMGGNNHD